MNRLLRPQADLLSKFYLLVFFRLRPPERQAQLLLVLIQVLEYAKSIFVHLRSPYFTRHSNDNIQLATHLFGVRAAASRIRSRTMARAAGEVGSIAFVSSESTSTLNPPEVSV